MTEKSNYHGKSKRDRCYFCESGPPLREHHIIPQRFGGPDTDENVVELCDACHTRIERLYDKSFYEWFGITDEKGQRRYHRPCDTFGCKNRRRLKVNTVVEQIHAYQTGAGWNLELAMKTIRQRFLCRPCAAKIAKMIYDAMEGDYDGEIRGNLVSVNFTGKFRSAQEVLNEMVLESADE